MNRFLAASAVWISCVAYASPAQDSDHTSPYAGEERRPIKSLSADDIEQLQNGGGWGLAKAAELNGMPGPRHLLEMKDAIKLSSDQERQIRALFDEMKAQAIVLGVRLVDLEERLGNAFATRDIEAARLAVQLDEIARVQRDLRFVHLAAHLRTPDLLTAEQIRQYNSLRGYGSGDACAKVPQGHDEKMWREHNDCD